MQRVGTLEDPYTLRIVVKNLFVDGSLVRVVVPAPTFDLFFFSFFACNVPIAVPTRCHRRSSAPSYQVGSFDRDSIGVGKVVELRGPPRIQYRSRERNHHSRFRTRWALSRTLPATMDDQFTGDPFRHSAGILTSVSPP